MNVIVAYSASDRAMGKDGKLPWGSRFAFDRERFAAITMGHIVVMGRRTWESLPKRPLPGRINVVVSSSAVGVTGALVCASLKDVLGLFGRDGRRIFLIGGVGLFMEAFDHGLVTKVFRTVVHEGFPDCDVFYPNFDYATQGRVTHFDVWAEEGVKLSFYEETLAPHPERQYLDLVAKILDEGTPCADRTGTGTIRLAGQSMRFSLVGRRLPLLTSKFVSWKSVAEELKWFLSGSTDNKKLRSGIWRMNAEDHKRKHPEIEEGDLGPIYGHQWRHFGAKYSGIRDDYGGVDQIARLVKGLKENPNSRRHILTAWNPEQVDEAALPPCHVLAQFVVDGKNLTCILYQRSGDMGLGVPFNIASYAIFTHLLAYTCGYRAFELVHHIGDAHIYKNHVTALQEQLTNPLYRFPEFVIHGGPKEIDCYSVEDFCVVDYRYTHLKAKMVMSL
jgi:dihydrofolate reductase / thymidylate synthase